MLIIAKTFQGLEEVLAKEIIELGANDVEIGNRMVSFTGDKEMLYRANFCLRTAVRVLMPIKTFKSSDADDVYEVVKKMPWSDYMDVNQTFLIDAVVFSNTFRHSKFVAYRVKDAIADYFRETTGERPNVSISNPDIRINVHIAEEKVTISLDSSGESLHKRGYRTGSVAAPINEVLAAGMLRLAGWEGQCDLIDPFCGSGTILIEAALMAMNIYPGVFRDEFGFERWKDFDEDLLDRIYNDDSDEREFDHKIYGYDINRQAVAVALDNVRSAGVSKVVEVSQQDFYDFDWNGSEAMMMTNPPYGERITTDDILDLYDTIGNRLKRAFAGNEAWILSSHEECFDKIRLRPSTKFALYNGSLPCELRKYQVFSGKLSDLKGEGEDIKTDEERQRNAKYKPLRRRDDDSTFDGKSWRDAGGSRDDEHYFRSRPNRKDYRDDKKPFERKNPKDRTPLFEGDDEPRLNRHNFKWGDRGSDYEPEDGDRRPFGKDRKSSHHRDEKKFRRDDKGFRRDDKKSFEQKFSKTKNHKASKGGKPRFGFDEEGRPFRLDED